ncbi:hypothetical protein ACFLWX_04375 [Chloroflexota bacterium]
MPKVYWVDVAPMGGNAQRRLSFLGEIDDEVEGHWNRWMVASALFVFHLGVLTSTPISPLLNTGVFTT